MRLDGRTNYTTEEYIDEMQAKQVTQKVKE